MLGAGLLETAGILVASMTGNRRFDPAGVTDGVALGAVAGGVGRAVGITVGIG